jgi:hypothetical protein
MCSGWALSKPYLWQAAGGELDLMVLIGGAEERAAIQWEKSTAAPISTIKSNTPTTACPM